MGSTIVGVDFGSTSIRALELRNARGGPSVVRYREEPLPPGAVSGGEVLEVGTVTAALKRLWAAGRFSSKEVAIGMGGAKVFSREVSLPLAPLDRLRESLPFQVQEMLPMPVGEALLDFYPVSHEQTAEGPMVNGLLIAAVKEAVVLNVEAVLGAGLRPVHVDIVPFALSRALTPIGTSGGPTVIIAIGADTTHVVISHGGVPLFVRMIASGGDDVSKGIGNRLQIPSQQAETLMRQFGLARGATRVEDRLIVEAVYAAAWELVSSIRDTLSFYLNSHPSTSLSRLILTGGASALPGLHEALAEITGVPVVPVDPFANVEFAKPLRRLARGDYEAMTTAFGLALEVSA